MKTSQDKGITNYEVDSWDELKKLLDDNFELKSDYAFRGQQEDQWELTPKITRILNDTNKYKTNIITVERTIQRHLDTFRKNIIGRRGYNPPELTENELWSLGQHHGLATPLLDWTKSPYAAVFFAFRDHKATSTKRAIWALDILHLKLTSNEFRNYLKKHPDRNTNHHGLKRGIIELIEPDNDENTRLINQSGLFTKIPYGTKLEDWANKIMKSCLYKITVPEQERGKILRSLDLMNINESTLFPDLLGAAEYTNYLLELHAIGSKNTIQRNKGLAITFDSEDLPE